MNKSIQLRVADATQTVLGALGIGNINIFGSIAGSAGNMPFRADFIPIDAQGNVIDIKGSDVIWKGLASKYMQYWAYCYCAPLASVIDRQAEADVNGEVEILKTDGTEDYSKSPAAKRILKLFAKPNPMQSWEQFRGEQIVIKKSFGYCPVFCVSPAGMDRSFTKYMFNISPIFCEPIYIESEKYNIYKNPTFITHWKFKILGNEYTIGSENIILLYDGYMQAKDTGLPLSKVAGLDYAISNICAAMEADNVLLRKRGPLGFISHDPKTDPIAGYTPMDTTEQNEVQSNLSRYGVTWSQMQYVISRHSIKWNPMSFNLKDLATKETIRQGIDMICDRFSYPAELMSGKNATYENRSSAEKYLYNTNIIPSNIRDFREYNTWFGFDGFKLGSSFEDFPLLQEDSVSQGQSEKAKAESNQQLFHDGLITLNMYRTRMGIDTIQGDDIYYNQWVEAQSKLFPASFTAPATKNTTNVNQKPPKN